MADQLHHSHLAPEDELQIYFRLALELFVVEEPDPAFELLEDVRTRWTENRDLHVYVAREYRRHERFDESTRVLLDILQVLPGDADLHFELDA